MRREIRVLEDSLRCLDFRRLSDECWQWNGAVITLRAMDPIAVGAFMGKTQRSFLCHYDPSAFAEYCGENKSASEDLLDKMYIMGQEAGNLHTPHNFVRFLYPSVLDFLDKVVHLDSDVVVKRDVADLYNKLNNSYALAAVPRTQIPLGTYFSRTHRWYPVFSWPSFNAGVVVYNLAYLRGMKPNMLDSIQALHQENVDGTMWRHGSQPPLLLMFYDKVQWIDEKWNVDGLGYRNRTDVDDAFILHWTGPLKPWREDGHNKHLWTPYDSVCGQEIKTWDPRG